MTDDAAFDRPTAGRDGQWIESLGLTEDEERVIQRSLEMADAVIQRPEAEPPVKREGSVPASEGSDAAEHAERDAFDRLVRDVPSMRDESTKEPYIQPVRPAEPPV